MTSTVQTPAPPRGGRDLRSAVLVGVGLLVTALIGLVWLPWLLVLLVVALLIGGVSEIAVAVRQIGMDVPRPPLWVGAAAMPLAAWTGGIPALFLALMAAILLMCAWTAATRRRPCRGSGRSQRARRASSWAPRCSRRPSATTPA